MATAELETPRTGNVTVKLDASERERLKALAEAKKRTPHYLMKEAITAYLEKEEAQQRFIQAGLESLAHYKATGLHVTGDEVSAWIKALKTNPKALPPEVHT